MLREHFPILREKTFLNSCSKGALSLEVRQAYLDYLDDWERLGSPWELWVNKLEQARHLFAELINAEPDEVAVVTSVSHAVSALASAFSFAGARKKIVVSDFEFPTVAQNLACARTAWGAGRSRTGSRQPDSTQSLRRSDRRRHRFGVGGPCLLPQRGQTECRRNCQAGAQQRRLHVARRVSIAGNDADRREGARR